MRRLRVAGCLLLLAAACSDDFTPRSVLADLRVLAVEGSRLEAGPGERVTLRAVRLPAPGAADPSIAEHWSFCPFSIGATVGYACAAPSCEVSLDGTGGGDPVDSTSAIADPAAIGASVTADPGALAQQCLALLASQGTLPPDVPAELPRKVDTVFRYVANAPDGSIREAVQLVPFYPGGAPSPRNAPPLIEEVDVGGGPVRPGESGPALAPGAAIEVRVQLDPASAQSYVDDTGFSLQETLVVSFFTTAGRFDFDRANGPDARVKLKHDQIRPADAEALVWVVATDLRGGETVEGPFRVPIVH